VAAIRPTRPRGRPTTPGLTRDLILATAIRLADDEGVEAVSLRRVADELGVHPTSIYNHVPSKAAIFDGVIESLLVEAELPLVVPDWETWVRDFAAAIRRTARAHPGAFTVFLNQPGTGPVAARHIEAALDAFCRAGCSVEQAVRAVRGVSLAVLGLALEETAVSRPVVAPDLSHISADEHPRIFAAETAGLTEAASDPTWDLVVESLIAGFAATLPVTGTPRG
jgi:AcrR family transcriptional regulator